ncbi:MAG: peptidoglycan-binding protein [Bauldia sp.]
MNPGDTLPVVEDREGGLGRALQDRLAQLAARLERLTADAAPNGAEEARAALDARLEAFAVEQRAPAPSRSAVGFAASAAGDEDGRTMDAIAAALRDLGEPPRVEGLPPYEPDDRPNRAPPVPAPVLRQPAAAAPAAAVREPARPSPEDRLRTIRDRIDELKARHGLADAEPASAFAEPPAAAPADDFSDIADHLRARAPEPEPQPQPPSPSPVAVINLNQAIAEIAARQRMIDDTAPPVATAAPRADRRTSPPLQSPDRPMPVGSRPPTRSAAPTAPPPAAPVARPPAPGAMDSLTAEVAALRQDVSVLTRFVEAGVANDAAVIELGGEMRAIRAFLDSTALGTSLASLEAGYGLIVERLDAIDRRAGSAAEMQAIAQDFMHRMPAGERFDALAAELDRLAERVASGDHREELMRIEARLAAIDGHVAGGVAAPAAAGFAPSTLAATSRLESDVAATRRAVEALSEKIGAGGDAAIVRIEQRLAELSSRLEAALSEAPKADSVSDLFERLDRIAARGEAAPAAIETLAREIAGLRERERSELASLDRNIVALAERLDAAVGRGAAPDLDARLDELGNRLVALSAADPSPDRLRKIEDIEAQIAALSGRFETLSGAVPDAIAQLEGQMSALVSRIDAEPQRGDAIREVEANLARLEGAVEDSRRQSSAAMQDAARQAIRDLSGMTGLRESEGAIVEALKSDLSQLQAAVQNTSRRSADGIDEVHGTLDKVVERLTRLEADTRAESARALAAPAAVAAAPAVVRAEPSVAADPSPGSTAAQRLRGLGPIDDERDRPVEPGAWRPAAEPLAEAPKSERDRKADFIAAARRAAQAAAAEHASMRPFAGDAARTEAGAGPRTPSRVGGFVAANRRAIVLAAAAIVLTIAVVTVLKPFSGGGGAEPDPAPAEPAAAAGTTTVVPVPDVTAIADAPALAADGPVATTLQPPTGALSTFAAAAGPLGETAAAGPAAATAVAAPPTVAELVEPMPPEAVGSMRLRQAAAEGDAAALYEVGARYAEGRGVDRDSAEAATWFERAANRGLAVAQYRLGTMYEGGVGVEESRTEAQRWYLAAAEAGNVQSMHNLGVLLSQGIAGTPDFPGAIAWFTAAAEHGVRDSQYNLGVIYARGIGVTQELVLAYQWFAAAAAQGDLDAGGRRDEVANALDADQLAAARAAAAAWAMTAPDAAANTVPVPQGGWDSAGTLDTQTLVRTIQAALNARGFDAGPADGAMGPRTRDAIREFQATIGASATGEIDPQVLSALGVRA